MTESPRQIIYRLAALLSELDRVINPLPEEEQGDYAVEQNPLPPLPPSGIGGNGDKTAPSAGGARSIREWEQMRPQESRRSRRADRLPRVDWVEADRLTQEARTDGPLPAEQQQKMKPAAPAERGISAPAAGREKHDATDRPADPAMIPAQQPAAAPPLSGRGAPAAGTGETEPTSHAEEETPARQQAKQKKQPAQQAAAARPAQKKQEDKVRTGRTEPGKKIRDHRKARLPHDRSATVEPHEMPSAAEKQETGILSGEQTKATIGPAVRQLTRIPMPTRKQQPTGADDLWPPPPDQSLPHQAVSDPDAHRTVPSPQPGRVAATDRQPLFPARPARAGSGADNRKEQKTAPGQNPDTGGTIDLRIPPPAAGTRSRPGKEKHEPSATDSDVFGPTDSREAVSKQDSPLSAYGQGTNTLPGRHTRSRLEQRLLCRFLGRSIRGVL